jgi:hypothetical protein
MSALDQLLPAPPIVEVDGVDLALPAAKLWELVRHTDLARYSPLIRALFAIRTAPNRLVGDHPEPLHLRIDELTSSPEHPGFQILIDHPPHEVVVGAIGAVWQLDIPFVHVDSAADWAAFRAPGWAKVAWALRVIPLGEAESRLEVEVRVETTDAASWPKFRRYYRLIGPGSHFIRRSVLASLAREHGTPQAHENARALPGDGLLPDAMGQITEAIDVHAPPSAIWPWLLQMGAHRAGFYSIDLLDNENVRSARELHPELPPLRVGDVIAATRGTRDGFEVLTLDHGHTLVLGGLFDPIAKRQLPFAAARPAKFWQVTWAFTLEPRGDGVTRLHARARACWSPDAALHVAWIRPVHRLMQTTQLRMLAARAEGKVPVDDWRDVAEGAGGAMLMVASFFTPFLRHARSHWGLDEATAARTLPGDELVPEPELQWTHGIEIDAPAEEVWPWIAQLGADRGGFYSYQWLENVMGCRVKNAERVHPELALGPGDALSLHPKLPPFPVALWERGSHIVVHAKPDEAARAAGKPWVATSWGFYVEPLPTVDGRARSRFVSRFRSASSKDLASRLGFGPFLMEPIGFAMDRRMLLGVKQRVDEAHQARHALHHAPPLVPPLR